MRIIINLFGVKVVWLTDPLSWDQKYGIGSIGGYGAVGVAPPTCSPLMWLSGLLHRYRCQLDVNSRFTYYLNHLAPLCAALRRSRVAQCHHMP